MSKRIILGIQILLGMMLALSNAMPAAAEGSAADLSAAFIRVAKQNIPAVVHIEVTERQEVQNPFVPFESNPFLRRFFNVPDMSRKFKREVKGIGTGMIIDDLGHILTNHHVAGGATKIEVQLSDGQSYPAKLVGTDPKTDLAVIQISPKGPIHSVTFGDSDKVEVGEWVVAIGHPRGLDQTVTHGIISAKHRRGITDPSSYQDYLQTDAAINPGNSGGPLLNLQGEVIGVNAVIVSESGGFEGIGFTIPSNMALTVARSLIVHGKIERGWIGASTQDLTADLARTLKADVFRGAVVTDLVKGGPADRAGLMKNDVVIAYGGRQVNDSGTLRNEVAATAPGREVKLNLVRNGKREELNVTIDSLDQSIRLLETAVRERLGATVREASPNDIRRYGLGDRQGVVVTTVDARGPLAAVGFEVDDIIFGIDNQPFDSLEAFAELVSGLKKNQKVTLFALDHRSGNMGRAQVTVR